MAGSKKSATRAFFTASERNELKGRWGAASTRLTRESFLQFGSCNLCLLQARDPVSCQSGHLFCRECAVSNLLAQSKEIKQLKKEARRRQAEEEDEKKLGKAQTEQQDLESFEKVQAGLDLKRKAVDDLHGDAKRKKDTSFWIPSQSGDVKAGAVKIKQHPVCPVVVKEHDFGLKTLVAVQFNEKHTCPSCDKVLSNATKGVLAKTCGHVLCKSCSDKFQRADDVAATCYVCQADITEQGALTELKSDGTGFAGGGDNMVKREGVSFQFG